MEAARTDDEAAREHFSADTRVNFPLPGELATALNPNHPRAPHSPASGVRHPNPTRAMPGRRAA